MADRIGVITFNLAAIKQVLGGPGEVSFRIVAFACVTLAGLFAYGALRSAEWIQGRRGLYTLDDMFDDWLDAAN